MWLASLSMPSTAAEVNKNHALALLALTQFIVIIDASITNVALPSIGSSLKIQPSDLSWVVNSYTLTFGGFLLLGGRLADLFGRRRLFMLGLIVFGLGSFLGGLSQSEGFLVGARALQGLGAALVSPAALSILTTTFAEGAERNRALAVWGAVAGAGGAAGVLLGGVLTEIDWRLVLFVNVPVAAAAVIATPRVLAESRGDTAVTTLDIPGAITVTGGLTLLVYALVDAESAGWGSTTTVGRMVVAALLLAAFVTIELRTRHPLMPFSIFRLRTLRGGNFTGFLLGASLYSMFYFMSLYLQRVLHLSALETGLAFLPLALVVIVTAGGSEPLMARIGFKPVLVGGTAIMAAALLWFSGISADGSFLADVLGPEMVAALGLALAFVTVTVAAVTGTKPDEAGLASGLINTSQQLGGALGLAIAVSASNARIADFGIGGQGNPIALTHGYKLAFLICAGFAIAAALTAAFVISSRDSREHALATQRGEAPPAAV